MTELLRYGVAGVVNTMVGYAIFLFCFRFLSVSPGVSNAIGYAIALCVAFLLNKHFVFRAGDSPAPRHLRFLIAFVLAFALNQAVLYVLVRVSGLMPEVAQVFAMVSYTVAFYFLNKHFVFSRNP